jgi:hypothetical protein
MPLKWNNIKYRLLKAPVFILNRVTFKVTGHTYLSKRAQRVEKSFFSDILAFFYNFCYYIYSKIIAK